jgi:hypothetical protein
MNLLERTPDIMWSRLSVPLKVGIGFGTLGIVLTLIGIVRGNVPPNPASIAIALVIGGGMWFLVSWAVATAAVDVEEDSRPPAEDEPPAQAGL